MSILSNIAGFFGFERKMSSLELFKEIYGGNTSASGVTVNADTAIKVATVLACVRVIAEGVSQIPFRVYQEKSGSRQPATDHPLNLILHRKPNSWQTSFEFRETMLLHVLLRGNAYAFINRVGSGAQRRIKELIPISGDVTVERNADYSLTYKVRDKRTQEEKIFPQETIWHLRGLSWDGLIGMDAVALAREAIGLSISLEKSHSDMHANGAAVSGLLSVKDNLTAEQYAALAKWLSKYEIGGEYHRKPMILDRGATFSTMQMSGVDTQHIETRRHQIEEICRAFRVMPMMIGHPAEMAARAATESIFLQHVVHTLMPWCERIEQSADNNLLTDNELSQGYYTKFTVNGLMRGAAKDRAEFYTKALGSGGSKGWMTQNEVRKLEEFDPISDPMADELPQAAVQAALSEASPEETGPEDDQN
jgi:HK97 family phage portal protein